MKDDYDLLPTTAGAGGVISGAKPSSSAEAVLFGKGRYKFWALAAILLLAFWSMLTGTVTLKWSAGDLNRLTDDIDTSIGDDLDVLEMEEREKLVRHMWDVYSHNQRIRLPRFWQEAFEAAYEDLAGDDQKSKDEAIQEITRMSMRMVDLEPPRNSKKKHIIKKVVKVGDSKPIVKSSSSSSSVEAH